MRALALAAALSCAVSSRAAAQDSVPQAQAVVPDAPPEESAWRFSVTPYAWLNGVRGRVGSGGA